jgi:putative redox protein
VKRVFSFTVHLLKNIVNESKVVGTAEALNQTGAYKTLLTSHDNTLIADEPIAAGGNNEGPAPGDYICMSLAACKAITLRMYVQRKQWDAGEIIVKVDLVREESATGPAHSFLCEVSTSGTLTNEQKERLLQIDKACPISKLLSKGSVVTSVIK